MRADGLRAETIRSRLSAIELLAPDTVDQVTPQRVVDYCRERGLSPGTLYQYHSIAAVFTAWALDHELLDADPFRRARRPPKPRYRARPAGTADLDLILTRAREPMRSWAILAAYAGLRCGEIAQVSGRDLVAVGDSWELRVPEGKGGRPGSIPAHPMIVALLADRSPDRVWVGASAQSVSARANAEFRRLGARCTMHQLRHAFGTQLYLQTRDVMAVQHALRHEHLETTARYIAFDDSAVRSAIACLAFPRAQRVGREVAGQEHDQGDDRDGDGLVHLHADQGRDVEDADGRGASDGAGDDFRAGISHGLPPG
jgi:integrase